ncbi:MAG: CRTAC1 family protein [candidate division WOR-3 bacterium]
MLVFLLLGGDIEEGVLFRRCHMFSEAERALKRAIYVGEDTLRAKAELAITYYKWREYSKAIPLFSDLRDLLNDEMWGYYMVSLLETDSARFLRLADSLFRQNDTFALRLSLEAAWLLDDQARADSAGLRLISLDPNCPGSVRYVKELANNALVLPDSERIRRIAALEERIWRCPAFSWPLRIKIVAMLSVGDTTGAIAELRRWTKRRPDDPELLLTSASLVVSFGLDVHEAADWAKQAYILAEERPIEGDGLESSDEKRLRALFYHAMLSAAQDEELWRDAKLPPLNNDLGLVSMYHYTMGILERGRGNRSQAAEHFLLSVILGSPRNTWPEKSLIALSEMGIVDPVSEARSLFGYSGIKFSDKTVQLGFPADLRASRVAVGDYNRDGWEDVLLQGRLFENQKGKGFREVTDRVGLSGVWGSGAIFLDYDKDGWDDILIIGKAERLFRNEKGKRFAETHAGLSDTLPTEGASAFDLNGDGWPEIYLANYESGGLGKGTPDLLYLNEKGKYTPTDIGPETLCGRGVAPCDFDLDGDMDLYVTNYRLQRNFLYINQGGFLTDSAFRYGVAGRDTRDWFGHSIGASWADYDNDGDFDLIVCNLAHPRYIDFSEKTVLYQATGNRDAPFQDLRQESGITYDECHSEPLWGDFDNDGDLDLFITSVYEKERSYLYQNMLSETGEARFQDVTYLAGARVLNGWGNAVLDFDHDGDLDIAIGSGSGFRFLVNETDKDNSWIEIEGLPRGAVVRLVAGDDLMMRQVEFAKGTTSQSSQVLHFGLGGWKGEVAIEVSFTGKRKTIRTRDLMRRMRIKA